MIAKPTLLFYCQHTLGMGHIARALQIVEALSERFRVVFINGGRFPEGTRVPYGVDVVDLPPLGLDAHSQLISFDPMLSVEAAQTERKRIILELHPRLRPDVIMIELFPFGRKKFSSELLLLLEQARRDTLPALVLCSLRDILVQARPQQQRHDDNAATLVNEYFDAVLVHADPAFARLEESFRPAVALRKPVIYTGFVAPARGLSSTAQRQRRLLVSAGGGIVGRPLFQAALEAQSLLWPRERLPMTVVGGPFLCPADRQALKEAVARQAGVEFLDSLPGLLETMQCVSGSISQCGYNTAMDVLRSGVPALVVPFAEGNETEQRYRATRLARMGLVRCLDPEVLSGSRLAQEIVTLNTFRPAPLNLDLGGVGNTVRAVHGLFTAHGKAIA